MLAIWHLAHLDQKQIQDQHLYQVMDSIAATPRSLALSWAIVHLTPVVHQVPQQVDQTQSLALVWSLRNLVGLENMTTQVIWVLEKHQDHQVGLDQEITSTLATW